MLVVSKYQLDVSEPPWAFKRHEKVLTDHSESANWTGENAPWTDHAVSATGQKLAREN